MPLPLASAESGIPQELALLYATTYQRALSISGFFKNIHPLFIPANNVEDNVLISQESGRWVAETMCNTGELLRIECVLGKELDVTQKTDSEDPWLKIHYSFSDGLVSLLDQRNCLMYLGTAKDAHEIEAHKLLSTHFDTVQRSLRLRR